MLNKLGAGEWNIAAAAVRQPLCGRENACAQFRIVVGLAACVIIMGAIGAAVQAKTLAAIPFSSAAVSNIGVAKSTMGWANFCQRFLRECAIDASEPATIQLT
ncbi:MAG: hypothetical protein ABW003_06655, partial [Microvirga sp.]